MAALAPPRTPTPGSGRRRKADGDQSPLPIGTMTPPPSDRKARPNSSSKMAAALAQTPSRQGPKHSRHSSVATSGLGSGSFSGASPTAEQIRDMPDSELRDLVNKLVPALGEARMELAHVRLQFQLLSMETQEQAQRAEVEHDMTRKELEVMQAGSPVIQSRAMINPDPHSSLALAHQQRDEALQVGRQLEQENAALARRLRDAKRVIKYLDGQNFELKEKNMLLRQRIIDNRTHFNEMRAAGLIHSTPSSPAAASSLVAAANSVSHYATPARPRKQADHLAAAGPGCNKQLITPNTARPQDDPFGALLFAGEVLNAQHQRASVPSTPSPARTMRQPVGHTRGTLSLSSLPVTPKATQFAPINSVATPTGMQANSKQRRQGQERRGSASTISDSDDRNELLLSRARAADDGSLSDEEFPGSQASRMASDLLRRQGDGYRQTTITGRVIKNNAGKRIRSNGGGFDSPKKQKTTGSSGNDGLGLGIGMWPSPAGR